MGAASQITIDDGESTPVTRVFDVSSASAGRTIWENRAGGILVGNDKLTFTTRRPQGPVIPGQNRNIQHIQKLELPVLLELSTGGTAAGYTAAPKVDHRLVVELKWTLPEGSAMQDRKNLQVLTRNLMYHAVAINAVTDYNFPY